MNSWKLNGIIGHVGRLSICRSLGIQHTEIYKEITDISINGTITTKDGKQYVLVLKEKKDETRN